MTNKEEEFYLDQSESLNIRLNEFHIKRQDSINRQGTQGHKTAQVHKLYIDPLGNMTCETSGGEDLNEVIMRELIEGKKNRKYHKFIEHQGLIFEVPMYGYYHMKMLNYRDRMVELWKKTTIFKKLAGRIKSLSTLMLQYVQRCLLMTVNRVKEWSTTLCQHIRNLLRF